MAVVMTKGDFNTILRETQTHIRAYIAGMGIASHEVDDVAQDVYIEFYKNQKRMPADLEPIRWLKGIARNVCLNHIRRSARRGRLHREALAEMLIEAESEATRNMEEGPAQLALEKCIEKLPDKSKRLVTLRYTEDRSSDAIAELMDSSAQAIRVALHRIRGSLKDCISASLARERWR